MSVIWNDSEVGLLEALRPVLSTREIHKVFGSLGYERSMEAISKKARQLGVSFKDFGAPSLIALEPAEQQAIQLVLQEREDQLASIAPPVVLSPSQKSQCTIEKRTQTAKLMEDLLEIRKTIPRTSSVSTKRASEDGESLCILLSDSHIGRVLHDDKNEITYSTEIGLQRLRQTPEKILNTLTEGQIARIDEVVICLIGDHVDGEGVFPSQEMSLEIDVAKQVAEVTKAIWHVAKTLSTYFPMVRIVTTKGNHGRTGLSPDANWDNMVFLQLELIVDLENNPNITIKNRYGDYNIVEVKGWRGLLRHKAPVQSDTASGISKFAGWHGIHEWNWIGYAHWHHWGIHTWNGKPIFRNGSLMGGDDYAETLACYDEPVQLMFGISSEQVPTFVTPIRYK